MDLPLHLLGMFAYEPPAVHVLTDATKALQICKTMPCLTVVVTRSRYTDKNTLRVISKSTRNCTFGHSMWQGKRHENCSEVGLLDLPVH